ncbi:MAG: hypothetical protein KatS3mg057_2658 [Herpetosiphonaceae bacterium]|nr:MAG: hypothetical protein KatS3mg057_2658 [Herpetosiphonaceae bacterium]
MSAAEPIPQRVDVKDGQLFLPLNLEYTPKDRVFVIDIYAFESNIHPEFHLGWWAWPISEISGASFARFVYHSPEQIDVRLICGDEEREAPQKWFNPDYRLRPLQRIKLYYHDQQQQVRMQAEVIMGVNDEHLLQAYYADNAHTYAITHPFLETFHQRRLKVLGRLFRRYIRPGSNVLDVGSGHSMFYLIGGERWPYRISCIDLDRALMKQAAPERPSYNWMVASLQHLPFADESFDAVYAGEVIEHVPDGDKVIAEWGRVVRPGGILMITTPNRRRLLNRINRAAAPVSFEHLIEYTCSELDRMFEQNGFRVLAREGIYLELLSLWRQRPPYVDPLTVPQPLRRHLLMLKLLMMLGRPLPQLAFDLVFVGQKRYL